METPLVSVVCLCYNHERFVEAAIQSVLNQTYPNIQLIVVDDASTDNSVTIIRSLLTRHPELEFLALPENEGNCSAFNKGLALTKGEFIIDLAADDILLPDRIEKGVNSLIGKSSEYGVHFSDADIIDEYGAQLYRHSDRFPHQTIPQGDVYAEVIRRYFICPPTVMFSRAVADVLGGYDETLSYEDFDFWVRSARCFKFAYSTEVLVKRRVTVTALGAQQFELFSRHSKSTFRVCQKILALNKNQEEQRALHKRILYEIGLNTRLLNAGIVVKFFVLLLRNALRKYP